MRVYRKNSCPHRSPPRSRCEFLRFADGFLRPLAGVQIIGRSFVAQQIHRIIANCWLARPAGTAPYSWRVCPSARADRLRPAPVCACFLADATSPYRHAAAVPIEQFRLRCCNTSFATLRTRAEVVNLMLVLLQVFKIFNQMRIQDSGFRIQNGAPSFASLNLHPHILLLYPYLASSSSGSAMRLNRPASRPSPHSSV